MPMSIADQPDSESQSDDFDSAAGAIDDKCAKELGRRLKAAYADLLSEPLPQHFVDLLDQLAERSEKP